MESRYGKNVTDSVSSLSYQEARARVREYRSSNIFDHVMKSLMKNLP